MLLFINCCIIIALNCFLTTKQHFHFVYLVYLDQVRLGWGLKQFLFRSPKHYRLHVSWPIPTNMPGYHGKYREWLCRRSGGTAWRSYPNTFHSLSLWTQVIRMLHKERHKNQQKTWLFGGKSELIQKFWCFYEKKPLADHYCRLHICTDHIFSLFSLVN